MREVKAGDFKAKCLALLDEVAATGEPIVVTKRGKPVARVEPAAKLRKPLFGSMKGKIWVVDPNDDLEPNADDLKAVEERFDRLAEALAPSGKRRR